MSRILAVSDIHIHDYPQRNPAEKYRLYQTRLVTKNILQVAQAEGAEYIVICGDIMDKWNPRPYVQAEIKLFLDTLMSYFKEGWIFWGNHDQDNKSVSSEFIDSCLSVMLPPNLHYSDKTEITLDGCRMGFMNWRPEFDLSWISGKLDVLFTHATISYTEDDRFTSQRLDESKFDLAICGDIHRPATRGKYVSIGIPQRCKMGDSDISSGVLLDTSTRKWKWVNLNPSGNLMKFQYTGIRENEGWDANSGIWNVYKPDSLNISGGIRDIKVPAWEEIDHLITEIITQNNLEHIHGEILKRTKSLDSKEVDFNFILTHFACKNWRSIDEADIYFSDLDRILITGENGSGKSSLLSAIRYAFLENRSIKDFLQFGTKECMTEVEFLYQGNQYKIQRGFQNRGGYTKLWMNGEEQKSNSKTDLDEEIHTRFPFIDYMDVYFFDSDHHKLIGGITPERKSEIISKFYKMDKIDAFHEVAENILGSFQGDLSKWNEEIDKSNELLTYIDGKLGSLALPTMSEDELLAKKQYGLEIHGAWEAWNQYVSMVSSLNANKVKLESIIEDLREKTKTFSDSSTVEQEIKRNQATIDQINEDLRSLEDIKTNGTRVRNERDNLERSQICPTCGRPLDRSDQVERRKAELEDELSRLVNLWRQKKGEILSKYGSDPQSTVRDLGTKISEQYAQKKYQDRVYSDLSQRERELESAIESINNFGPEPPRVELPEGYVDEMTRIEAALSEWQQYNSLMQDRAKAVQNISRCQGELDRVMAEIRDLQDYIKLTGPTGKIYEEIMSRLANQFSDNQVRYVVERTTFRRKEHLDLASYYINNGNEVSYQACSSGQKTILDVNFLGKIVTRMGLLVMDEFLKHLDAKNHDICIDMLKEMNIGCIMLSSHMESVPAFNNKSLFLELNESGVTKIQVK